MTASTAGQARTLIAKDAVAEFRTRAALNAVGVSAFSSLLLVALATRSLRDASVLTPMGIRLVWDNSSKMALLWVVLAFAAFSGLAHTFVHEEDAGTAALLRAYARPAAIYCGKLAGNFLAVAGVALLATPVYALITGMSLPGVLVILLLASGCAGLAATATAAGAIAARARSGGGLYAALGLPFITVFLMLLLGASSAIYDSEASAAAIAKGFAGLISFAIMLIGASLLVFETIWED